MKNYIRFISLLSIIVFISSCNREIRSYLQSKETPLKVHLEPTVVEIDIYFLRSISSRKVSDDKLKAFIKQVSKEHADWFHTRLQDTLKKKEIEVVTKDKADLILESTILDMGEVRARKFIEGLSVGLVLGWIVGEMTGDPEVGLAVFVWEVIEEIIIVYLLKSFFMITTIGLTVKKPDGSILAEKEFTSYSNSDYEKTLPEVTRSLRENKVHGSLDQNAQDIADFLKIENKKRELR